MSALRSAAIVVGLALAGGAAMAVAYGVGAGLQTGWLLALVGAPVPACAHLLVRRRGRLGSLRRALSAAVGLTIGLSLLGVAIVAALMFVSVHDAFTLGLLLAAAGVLAVSSTWMITARVTADVRELRDAVAAIGAGERDRRLMLESDDELADLAREINRTTAQLAAAESAREANDASRRDLLAAVSHDLRTPLSSMCLLVDAMRDDLLAADERDSALRELRFHADSLDGLIGDLFELSRIEAGDTGWAREPLLLSELVVEAVEGMRTGARARGVQLLAQTPREGAERPVDGSPERIGRVLFNLIDNALRHTPPGGRVVVTVVALQGATDLEVADTGPGISDADAARVFEPFFRGGPDGSRPRGGAGLGLPICRAIIEAHGGQIELRDATTQGTTIGFCLRSAEPGESEHGGETGVQPHSRSRRTTH